MPEPIADPEFRTHLLRVADRLEPSARRVFLEAARDARTKADLDAIAAAIERGDDDNLAALLGALALALALRVGYDRIYRQAIEAVAPQSSQMLEQDTGAVVEPEAIAAAAAAWAAGEAGTLAAGVESATEAAIQAVVREGREAGRSVSQIVALLVTTFGLTEQQAQAVTGFYAELLDDGRSATQAGRLAGRYADKLLDHRAGTLSRDQTVRAVNAGQSLLWREAVRGGQLSPEEWLREWVAILGDGRVCAICYGAHGSRAPIGGYYPNGYSEPHAHPRCRCGERLVAVGSKPAAKPPFIEPADGGTLRPAA